MTPNYSIDVQVSKKKKKKKNMCKIKCVKRETIRENHV